jgi:hypothetical protein
MHNSLPGPIKVNLEFSAWLASYLLLMHLLASVIVILLDLGLALSSSLLAFILFSLIYHWRRYLLYLHPNSVIGVEWSHDRGWLIGLKSGNRVRVELCPTSFVSRSIMVLHFNSNDYGRRNVAIAGDALDRDQLRRLRVLLKMHNHFGV